jgi:hypothetical protein
MDFAMTFIILRAYLGGRVSAFFKSGWTFWTGRALKVKARIDQYCRERGWNVSYEINDMGFLGEQIVVQIEADTCHIQTCIEQAASVEENWEDFLHLMGCSGPSVSQGTRS